MSDRRAQLEAQLAATLQRLDDEQLERLKDFAEDVVLRETNYFEGPPDEVIGYVGAHAMTRGELLRRFEDADREEARGELIPLEEFKKEIASWGAKYAQSA